MVIIKFRFKNNCVMMKKKECPSCAMEIPDDSKICPICGYEFPQRNKSINTLIIVLLIILLLYFLI